jgi:tRNA(Ile)-lysidine synthase
LLEKQFQHAIVEHLATLADLAREDEAYLEGAAELRMLAHAKENEGAVRVPARDLADVRSQPPERKRESEGDPGIAKMSQAIPKRIVRLIVASMKPRAGQLGARHVEAVLELARSGQSGSSLALPGGMEVRRERDELVFRAAENAERGIAREKNWEYEYNINLESGVGEVRVPELACVFRIRVIDWPPNRGETKKDGAVLDRERLRFPIVLRNWRPGDWLRPAGHRSAHKLKRLLNEKRVSRWERAGWPVLTSGGVLVWARGFPVAAEYAADERTRAGVVIVEEKS